MEAYMSLSVDNLAVARSLAFDLPQPFDTVQPPVLKRQVADHAEVRANAPTQTAAQGVVGRAIDVSVAAICLAMMLPALLVIAVIIWGADGASPIFAHQRVGRGRAIFPCFKFRTMVMDADDRLRKFLEQNPVAAEEWRRDHKLRDDPRITRIGRFLRKYSLDEIPQLANVLLGHMSLVGPRPIVEEEQARYGRYLRHYLSVRPGITGLWQVSGRNSVTYRRRVALDTHYARSKKSLRFDLMILTMTIPAVLLAKGSS
jgi:exopolysaccharide production protein ExoY